MNLARLLAFVSCTGSTLLWLAFLYANPYGRKGFTTGTYVVGWVMVALAGLAAYFAATNRAAGLIAVFLLSFLPLGLYLAGTPGIFRWIAVFDLGLFLAAVVLWYRAR